MVDQEYKALLDSLMGIKFGWHSINYNWRDVALYALAVGAGQDENVDEIDYYYEKNLKVIPTFGALVCYTNKDNNPPLPIPDNTFYTVKNALIRSGRPTRTLALDHEIIFHRPIDAYKGTLVYDHIMERYWDRGEGKGTVVKMVSPVYNEAGQLLCENISNSLLRDLDHSGGEPLPKSNVVFPDREPDVVKFGEFSKVQNAIYRLTGDTNYVHIDPEYSMKSTGTTPYMQGLCPEGFACRMAVNAAIPGQPERAKRLKVQNRNLSFPGDKFRFEGWFVEEGKMFFRMVNTETGKAILDKGEFEWA